MAEPQITIVGLGCIGGSIGLRLHQERLPYRIVGHDLDHRAASQAMKMKAVDKAEWNLIAACEPADVIVLALPLSGIRDTLQAIAPYLKEGCIITDTASVKGQVLRWAEELLPETVSCVGGDPIIKTVEHGVDAARDDLFCNALYCLTPAPGAPTEAVQTIVGLVHALGALPFFLDATEHDGLMAGVEHLPLILAIALLRATTPLGSWRDMRKLAGGSFEQSTGAMRGDPDALGQMCLANSANLTRWIDASVEELQRLRGYLADSDREGLREAFEATMAARERWLVEREQGHWDDVELPPVERGPGMLKRLIGIG
jgi:prephenate dehydrogenase